MSGKPKRTIMNRFLWGAAYVAAFGATFTVAAVVGLLTSPGLGGALTLQGSGDNSEILERTDRSVLDIAYIDRDGVVTHRPVVLYRPQEAQEPTALVFVPHYEIGAGSSELGDYLREGWAVASPTEVETSDNGRLVDDDLVFNNAALHVLRELPQIDPERIALVGGSAGGYTALMLSALQLGTTATVASAPITNAYFNFDQYFDRVDKTNKEGLSAGQLERLDSFYDEDGVVSNPLGMMLWARWNDLPFPLLSTVFPSFAPIAETLPADSSTERWEAFSPTALAGSITSPLAINHNTSDMLVPLDQVSSRYAYEQMGQSIPPGFTNLMDPDYPGVLSRTFEDQLDPATTSVNYIDIQGAEGEIAMPVDDRARVNINVYDDGPPERNSSHGAVDNAVLVSHLDYLRDQLNAGLAATEALSHDKMLLLLQRYQGDSVQLPAHQGVSDTTYGSLAVYQQEIIETLSRWADNNSRQDLQTIALASIETLPADRQQPAREAWTAIEEALSS